MAGAAVGATALLVGRDEPRTLLPLLCVIWGVCGLVALVAVAVGLGAARRRDVPGKREAPPKQPAELPATAIREEVPPHSPVG
jgi:hypothetical protein